MAKYLDSTGLTHLWAKIKNYVQTYVSNLNLADTYVAKESGKGLSTNDYTTTEKTKLSNIASGAEVNLNAFSNVKVGSTTVAADAKTDTLTLAAGGDVTITPDATNDKVTISVTTPKKVSDLTNDSGFITLSQVPEGAVASSTTPLQDGTAAVGTETAFARGDHRHPTDTSRAADNAVVHLAGAETISGSKNFLADQTIASTYKLILDSSKLQLKDQTDWSYIYRTNGNDSVSLLDSLNLKANLASPTFTGTPKAPTATAGTNTTQVATTAFVHTAVGNVSTSSIGAIPESQKGVANGVATLDTNGLIPSTQLPSYVDDVVEVYARSGQTALSQNWFATGSASGTVVTPTAGKIYVLMADSGDYSANSLFRWGSSTYVKLNDGGVSAITNAEIDSITSN